MKTILMCEPTYYNVEYVINPWMRGNVNEINHSVAKQQWDQLKNIISQYAKIEFVNGKRFLPDMVFTANAGLPINKKVIVSQFKNIERQKEREEFSSWFENNHYDVISINNNVYFEGAGDCLKGKGIYWCGYGFRTSYEGGKNIQHIIKDLFGMQTELIELVDENFYHLDTCFCPLNDDSIMIYKPAISEQSYQKILNTYHKENVIEVDEYHGKMFTCNAVNINNVIITNYASEKLKQQLGERGFDVIETPMSEFIKSGGSCKCLTLEI